jgi:hypothetical protein
MVQKWNFQGEILNDRWQNMGKCSRIEIHGIDTFILMIFIHEEIPY